MTFYWVVTKNQRIDRRITNRCNRLLETPGPAPQAKPSHRLTCPVSRLNHHHRFLTGMNDPHRTPPAWDESWQLALSRYEARVADGFHRLNCLLRVVRQLHSAQEIRGLFAITSHDDLLISPYSCYPDWFNGRRIDAAALPSHHVRVRFAQNCYDPHPEVCELHPDDAVDIILRLCRDRL